MTFLFSFILMILCSLTEKKIRFLFNQFSYIDKIANLVVSKQSDAIFMSKNELFFYNNIASSFQINLYQQKIDFLICSSYNSFRYYICSLLISLFSHEFRTSTSSHHQSNSSISEKILKFEFTIE